MGAKPKGVTTGGPQGRTHPSLGSPELVPFGKLRVSVERFQVRNPKACSFVGGIIKGEESAQLSATLVQLIEAGTTLDPLVIWQDSEGTRWVIDGHHRMEAMTEAGTSARAKV